MAFISFFISSVLLLVHPLHVSVTEIVLDPEEKELEITLRIFADDLELAVREMRNDENLNFLKPQGTTTDKLAWEYLESRFKISADRVPQKLNYLGHETEDDVLIFYIQVQPVETFESLSVTNSIITEVYDDQANLVNATVNDETRSLRLMRNNPSGKLLFDPK